MKISGSKMAMASVIGVALAGCGRPTEHSFTSQEIISKGLPERIGQGEPLLIRMSDGNLMAFVLRNNELHIYKTSSGYAESGTDASFPGMRISEDRAGAHIYNQITHLEALALFDNDWKQIYELAQKSSKQNPAGVSPKFIRYNLEPLVSSVPDEVRKILEDPRLIHSASSEHKEYARTAISYQQRRAAEVSRSKFWSTYYKNHETLSFKIPGTNDLLKILHIDCIRKPTDPKAPKTHEVFFAKTSQGYAVSGAGVGIGGYSMGFEKSQGMVYTDISAREAISLIGSKEKIIEAAEQQLRYIKNSANPEVIRKALDNNKTFFPFD